MIANMAEVLEHIEVCSAAGIDVRVVERLRADAERDDQLVRALYAAVMANGGEEVVERLSEGGTREVLLADALADILANTTPTAAPRARETSTRSTP